MKLKKDNVYKITVPIITNEELKRLDNALENDLDKIVQEITEVVSKDREIIILQKVIKKQQKRNKKLKRKLNQFYGMIVKDYISKDKINDKLEQIRKEYNNILSSDNVSLDFKNINSHRFDAMSQVLEELLKGI